MKQVASKHSAELREGVYCGLGKSSDVIAHISIDLFSRWTLLRDDRRNQYAQITWRRRCG